MTVPPDLLARAEGFDWDEHNVRKIWAKHAITSRECEEALIRVPRLAKDTRHSVVEERFYAFGRTANGRRLTIVFTLRGRSIRVVTARDQSRKERSEEENS